MPKTLCAVVVLLVLAAGSLAHAQNDVTGAWEMTTVSPEGTFTSNLEIRQEGDKLVAIGKSPQGERPYDTISVDGGRIVLVITISYNGAPLVITYRGDIAGTEMSGDADFGGMASGSWSAARK